MMRIKKKRIPWSEERRAKVAATWERRLAEETANEEAGGGTKKQGKFCIYCGEDFDLKEPVPSIPVRRTLSPSSKVKLVLVPVCTECNSLLKFNEQLTVRERRVTIKILLTSKYEIFLDWDELMNTEYEHLTYNYRELLDRMNNAKRRLEKRLAYKQGE